MSEDVTRFLSQLKELGERRIEEDEARSRELEEKILQDRKERQARRRERARSISPLKSSPVNTPSPSTQTTDSLRFERLDLASSPILIPPSTEPPPKAVDDDMPSATSLLTSPSKRNELPLDAETEIDNPLSPTLNGSVPRGLSWQRRPNSHTPERSRTRPLSVVAAENAARSSTVVEQDSLTGESLPKDQMPSSLSSKEPWSRQTADRGASSAAYRRSQLDDTQPVDILVAQTQLPAMPLDVSGEPSRNANVLLPGSSVPSNTFASHTNLFNGPKLDPPESIIQSDIDSSREMLGHQSRNSPPKAGATASPTKGVGGFVQSAMLKRSESVNKRWSVQSPPTLHRADPIVSNRQSYDFTNRTSTNLNARPIRPGSGDDQEEDRPQLIISASPKLDTVTIVPSEPPSLDFDTATPPISPSKTMDSRRWSPQKSSWLESALNKPESPKPKPAQPVSNQPAWMAELQKAKAQKAAHPGTEGTKPPVVSHKHQVSIGGLMRSSAPGVNTAGSHHGQSHSISGVSAFLPLVNSDESKPPTLPSLVKPKCEPAGDNKLTGTLPSVGVVNPTTPPKTDFRATLKPSASTGTSSAPQKTEFKNIIGNLRKTTTQNYVAPDEFRGNITRGKAALSVTGGPHKSERVDEFKEALLAKKKEFKAANPDGWKIPRTHSVSSEQVAVPESILKRAELGRSNTVKRESTSSSTAVPDPRRRSTMSQRDPAPSNVTAADPRRRSTTISQRASATASLSEKLELFNNLEKRGSETGTSNPKPEDQIIKIETPTTISRPASVLADRATKANSPPRLSRLGSRSTDRVNEINGQPGLSRPVSMFADQANDISSAVHSPRPVSMFTDRNDETSGSLRLSRPVSMSADRFIDTDSPPRAFGKLGVGALANRFNPALGNLLARGPPSAASNSSATGKTEQSGSPSWARTEGNNHESGSGPKLTHMTRTRARGPKRKAPTAASAPFTADNGPSLGSRENSWEGGPDMRQTTQVASPRPKTASLVDSSKEFAVPTQPRLKPIALIGASKLVTDFATPTETFPSPSEVGSRIHGQVAAFAAQSRQAIAKKISDESQHTTPLSPSPGKLNMSRMSRFMDIAPTGDKGREEEQPKRFETPIKKRHQDVQAKSEPCSPSLNKSRVPWQSSAPLAPKQQPAAEFGSVDTEFENRAIAPLATRPAPLIAALPASESLNLPVRPLPEAPVRPLPAAPIRVHSSRDLKASNIAISPMQSPTKQSPDASVVLRDFFGSDQARRKYNVDAAKLLMQHPDETASKIWTMGVQLFLISAGRKQIVPAHHEGTLFEREIYLCTHSFKNEFGRDTAEVYFWIGDEVPEASIESAAILAAQEARSFGGTLIELKQGKETPGFLQALGGIVITHRGSANIYDSLAPHMLCGRNYHGHVVFDEVDFSPAALCSGFPYLITQGGKCYLWKGKGSSIHELSCARLIGTDYALSGEMEEVEEGQEPELFWDLFNGGNRFGSADHWRLKPNYDKYRCRLFLSDVASEQQIAELSMFSQADLLPSNIYVIDAFFELYIVVGARAQSQYASFHNALEFSQEYAILAASMEDRPFVPVSTVVLEGIPRDMKSVFRKWQDARSPTITNVSVGLKRGRSLKIVPLSQALQALNK